MITAKDVFLALIAELDHPQGYVTRDPLTLNSICVDGTVDCESIAEYLNQASEKYEKARRPSSDLRSSRA